MRGRVRWLGDGNAIAVLALWLICGVAGATDVRVVGLFHDKAFVVVDGAKPRMMSAGQTLGAVRLISATSDAAVFEIDGKRRTLTTGGQVIIGSYAPSSKPTVTLNADSGGHYYADGSINGIPIRFLVDTGATMVSMGVSDARRIGINYLQGQRGISNTANGPAVVYRVKLNTVKVGSITLNNVDGLVHESANMPFALLGMSFLNRLDLKREQEQLTMTLRY
ncbi:MAG: TIGR02281 family clan AA aspartic protease [Betaproteobacteria bacterium]|nr:TIGR02281 family clan AA aspartic protease [Betaproteobacteria bacterium]